VFDNSSLKLEPFAKSYIFSIVLFVGSPFQFTVGPIAQGGAHKVRALGSGLERAIVNIPSKLNELIIQ